jgi:hypothetical protein
MLPPHYPSFGGQAMLDEKQPTAHLENAPHLVQCGVRFGIEHRVQVITRVSKTASENGICSAEARP